MDRPKNIDGTVSEKQIGRHFRSLPFTLGFPARLSHLKALKREGGRNRTPDKSPLAETDGMLPLVALHDDLRPLASAEVGAEDDIANGRAIIPGQREPERRTRIVVPDLDGVAHAVPVRETCRALQEVVDAGAVGAVVLVFAVAVGERLGVPEGLDVEPLFWVRGQVQSFDDLFGREGG